MVYWITFHPSENVSIDILIELIDILQYKRKLFLQGDTLWYIG